MKYLKTFENIDTPEIDDYVIIKLNTSFRNSEDDRLEGKIWKIISVRDSVTYKVHYKNVEWYVGIHEITHFSKDKEHLKLILKSEKYNL